MAGQFSTSHQPAGKRKAKTAHRGAHKKHVRSAALAELKATRAVKRAVLQGKLQHDDDGKSNMEENTNVDKEVNNDEYYICLLYTSPSPRDGLLSRMPSSA